MKINELESNQVRFSFDEKRIAELRTKCKRSGIIGQPRALSALKVGMSVDSKGYNIYISGEDGTGRKSAVRQIAQTLSAKPKDVVSAYNFSNPSSPLILLFPSPEGTKFCNQMQKVATEIEQKDYEKAVLLLEKELEEISLQLKQFEKNSDSYEHQFYEEVHSFLVASLLSLKKNISQTTCPVKEKYLVKVLFNGSLLENPPVVTEYNPTSESLFGSLVKTSAFDHLNFSPGSVFSACSGFLILDIDRINAQPGLWNEIKLFAESSLFSLNKTEDGKTYSIRPQVSFLPVKLVLIGSEVLYDKLCENDEQFLRLFKIYSEFDFTMECTDENISGTIAYLLEIASKQHLKKVSDSALCELLRCSCRYAEMQDELTAKLSMLGDILNEANYFANEEIDDRAVIKALEERNFSSGIIESRIKKEIEKGEMIISLEGTKIGVVNGLAVIDRGLYSFGTPAVISVSVAPGNEGIVNIEHEAGLSGEIHDKGLLILEGYLRQQYAKNFALSIYAGICFEQSYTEVDGDSASGSELFALLSAIGEIPVRQEIACTGSVNQLGNIQPVGGINEKITAFFEICKNMGLTGRQGVIIPKQNICSLILPQSIVKAVEEKKFHIYPISTIDEGMEILTLRESGKRNSKGLFPMNTVNRIIEDRLRKLCCRNEKQ